MCYINNLYSISFKIVILFENYNPLNLARFFFLDEDKMKTLW